ncbi:flagellin lysine-N-methylase [Niameybacter massiliensis]|uniref:flagellin lysine-N-methylase n=1 Tax=Niameybacter massiliensis TaxID=1658108 RepID=UPI0006B697CA|nr:flagellin lysine-N-methylase [Niameybacter massiliensis]
MKKILMLIPKYIKEFKCTGTACEDTCCGCWKITIDERTYKKYKKIPDYEMRKKVEKYVGRNRVGEDKHEVAKIRLQSSYCPFLNSDKLCELQLKLGEAYLSNTCAMYPRLHKRVNGIMEQGLTLSCIEAAKVVLLNQDVMEFDQEEREFTDRDIYLQEFKTRPEYLSWKDCFWDMRIVMIGILQNRSYTIEERLLILGLLCKELDQLAKTQKVDEIPYSLNRFKQKLDANLYKNILDDIPSIVEMQLKLGKELIDIRYEMGINDDKYNRYISEIIVGLNLTVDTSLEKSSNIYRESYENYYRPFMDEHGYIFENYLVNYFFLELLPVNKESVFESYVGLILHYIIIKLHLIGVASIHKELEVENVIDLIHVLCGTYEHNPHYFNRILRLLKENGYIDLAHMAILIKN